MKLIKQVFVVVVAVGCLLNVVLAQDINFDDLKRQGKPLSKTVAITGLAEEARSNLSRFDEIDSSRVAQREVDLRAAAQRASQQPSQNTVGSSSKSSGKNFTCEVDCTSRTTQFGGEPLVGKVVVSINANDSSAARVDVRNNAGNACKSTFGSGAWYRSAPMMSGGSPYINCREAR